MNTKVELFDYVASLRRNNPNNVLTNEQLIEVGIMHKQLPQCEKSWNDLAAVAGYSKGGESYRQLTNRAQKACGDLPNKDLHEAVANPDAFAAAYKEKTMIRDIYNAYRLMLRKDARVDAFKDALIAAIEKLKPINFPKTTPTVAASDIEAVLMLSDLHIGVSCDNFYNKYNFEIALDRMNKLCLDTIKYCSLMNVSTLHVTNLGDMIHGLIHTTARIGAEMDTVEQLTAATELIAQFLTNLAKSGIKITYRSCTDNHSRLNANKSDNIEEENFSRIMDWYLACRLKDVPVDMINDNIHESLGKFTLKNGKTLMFAHGHLENINKCIDAFIGATQEFIDYVLLSHFHAGREKSYNGSKLFINGSIVGTEDYALSRRLFNPAEQKLLIFDSDNVLDININLQ